MLTNVEKELVIKLLDDLIERYERIAEKLSPDLNTEQEEYERLKLKFNKIWRD